MPEKPGPCLDHPLDFSRRVLALGTGLQDCAELWRPAPFHHDPLPWAESHPRLHAALLALSLAEVEALHADERRLRAWLAAFVPGMATFDSLLDLPKLVCPSLHEGLSASNGAAGTTHAPARDVPGRKWAQVEALARHAAPIWEKAQDVVDWCAGKAHLGRLLGLCSGLPVRALERDPRLCAQAERLARRDGVRLTARAGDVLQLAPGEVPMGQSLVCALHACGDLHLSLLDQVASQAPVGLLLAPCCYHRTLHRHYRPRSSAGRACGLRLTREELRLAVLETCTAGQAQREAEKRRKLRLLALHRWGVCSGLELTDYALLKDIGRDEDDHLALQRASERLGWPVPGRGMVGKLMRDAWRRAAQIRAFELIRAAIRRPLEVWLVLDMALGLAEQGYAVEVGEFCQRTLTPRNLLIRAQRRPEPLSPGGGQESRRDWP